MTTTSVPAWLAPFSGPVQAAILPLLRAPQGAVPPLACFDADGTLWGEDIGEAFFRWLSAGHLLPGLRERSAPSLWEEYERRVHARRVDGFAWVVQIMAGIEEAELRRWAAQLAWSWPTARPEMRALIEGLRAAGWEVWIVSASNRWIVEAAAPLLGVDPACVLGIEVAVEGGRLGDRVLAPIVCEEGKVAAIRQRIGRDPDLAFGDSTGDQAMLEAARVPVVVGRRDRPPGPLVQLGAARGWATHLF